MIAKKTHEKLVIYTDGGARGNPGPAAIAVVLQDNSSNLIKSYSEIIGDATNNEAEYQAVVFALRKVRALLGKKKCQDLVIELRLDSELVARQLRGEYKIEEEKLFPLFIKVWNLRMDFKEVKFLNIPREKNKAADRLVNEVLDRGSQGSLL